MSRNASIKEPEEHITQVVEPLEHPTTQEPNERIGSTDGLAVIREEVSGENVSVNLNAESSTFVSPINPCICKEPPAHVVVVEDEPEQDVVESELDAEKVHELLKAREEELRAEFEVQMEKEINRLKEKFDFILHNEQVRASVMLREAHRERREKVSALQTQLECKNMSGLMYVMCSERKRCALEKRALTEEYTAYIRALQNILVEAQALILQLSRGYKTAGRVDDEWRGKMKNVIKEFQSFVVHYMGDKKEACQYLFDIPKLLSTAAPVKDDLVEDPCTCEEEVEEESIPEDEGGFEEPSWWHTLESDCRPFVMFGDCEDLKPPQRRDMLRSLKVAEGKTVPKKWKEYKFNEMFINATCSNVEAIKEEYSHFPSTSTKWECHASQAPYHLPSEENQACFSRYASVDIRGNMGSILKLITAGTTYVPQSDKTTLLAARDSMEIQSSTRVLHHHSHGGSAHYNRSDAEAVVLDIKKRRQSKLEEVSLEEYRIEEEQLNVISKMDDEMVCEEETERFITKDLASLVNDSLVLVHKPCEDATINFERICPMKECQRMKVDSFVHSLPPYMKASPFTHFEQTFDEYEPCTPAQLDVLVKRIEHKKYKEEPYVDEVEDPLKEWTEVKGIATQTSLDTLLNLPPCTCKDHSPTPVESSQGKVYQMADLYPIKQMVNMVSKACLYDRHIDFNRFQVMGEEPSRERIVTNPPRKFMEKRIDEIKNILLKNPSLLDMFQANTQC